MHAKNKSYEIDMTHGPLTGKILLFTLPLIFSGILQLLFNAADIIVVGRFASERAVAAISSTAALINLLIGLFFGIGIGVNVLVAHFFATDSDRDVSETVHTSIAASLIAGVFLAFIGITLARPLLVMMDSPDDVIDQSVLYLRIYFAAMPANILYNTGSAILRAVGDTKRPLFFLTVSGIINVLLNLLTVIYFRMDVAGVGLATGISLVVSAALVLRCLMQTDSSYRFELKKMRITPSKLSRILQIGLPAGLQSVVFSLSNVLIQSSVNSFGSMAMAGNGASANIEGFVFIAMDSIYHACVTFTSQNYGILDMKRVRKISVICQIMVIFTGLSLGLLTYFFADPLLRIYVSDAEAVQTGIIRLGIICTMYFVCGSMDVLCGTIRGLGSAIMPMIISLVGACGFRILWIYTVFRIPAYHTLAVLYVSYPLSWALTTLVEFVYYIFLRKKINLQISLMKEKQEEGTLSS